MDFYEDLKKMDALARINVEKVINGWKPGIYLKYDYNSGNDGIKIEIRRDGHAHGVIYKNGVRKFYDWRLNK